MSEADSRFKYLVDGIKSLNKEEKLLSISALGILKVPQHADLLSDLLSSTDEEVIEHVLVALGCIGNPASVKHIVEFVLSGSVNIARIAYEVLKNFYLASALDVVINSATTDQPIEIRTKLMNLLSRYEDVRVGAMMDEVLGQTKDVGLLRCAIRYFIRFPSSERHTALKILAGSSQWEIALAANIALSRLKDEGAYSQVRRLVKSGNADIRQLIVDSLNDYSLIEDRDIYQIFFEDSRASIRKAAVKGLSLFGVDERIKILKLWLARETDKHLCRLLLQKAAKEHSILFYDEFYRYIQSNDPETRNVAIEALVVMGEKVADRIIIDFDRMPLVVREQMILALGKIGGDKVIKIIDECLVAKERWLRINAVEAVANTHSAELYSRLVEILNKCEADIWVRATAVSALGSSKNHGYAEVVASQLGQKDARVRANAIEALADLAWVDLPEACHELIQDRNDRVRVNAAIALWKSGHEEVFTELEKMSKNKSRWVRSSAVYALGKIRDRKGAYILLDMLNDPEEIVYKNVVEALAEVGDMRALLPLLKEARKNRLEPKFYEKALNRFSETLRE